MSPRVVTARVAAAIIGVSVAGCGSGTLSARALRAQATRVCTTAVRRSDQIASPRSNAGGATFLAQGITVFRSELKALRKLAPPHSLATVYRTALGDATQQLDALIATEHNLLAGGDPVVAIRQLKVELAAVNARDRAAWSAVGAPVCSNR